VHEKRKDSGEQQFVSAETKLGLVGNRGKSQGTHLHYSVYTEPGKRYATNVALRIFGNDYMSTAMTNSPGSKTVYDPTSFYEKYKDKYKK
jgi:murein DD-endopeptidase MepM/ murein hydrolase activator NlpD